MRQIVGILVKRSFVCKSLLNKQLSIIFIAWKTAVVLPCN